MRTKPVGRSRLAALPTAMGIVPSFRLVRAPVGEANVARTIRDEGAVIGGEGNGGVMLPALHIGRDAPLGVALILHLLATSGATVSQLVAASPRYTIVKAKGPRGSDLAAALRQAAPAIPRRGGRRPGRAPALLAGPLAPRATLRHRADRPAHRRGTDDHRCGGADRRCPRTLAVRFMA